MELKMVHYMGVKMEKKRDQFLEVVMVLFKGCANGTYKGSLIHTEEYSNNVCVVGYINVLNDGTWLI